MFEDTVLGKKKRPPPTPPLKDNLDTGTLSEEDYDLFSGNVSINYTKGK